MAAPSSQLWVRPLRRLGTAENTVVFACLSKASRMIRRGDCDGRRFPGIRTTAISIEERFQIAAVAVCRDEGRVGQMRPGVRFFESGELAEFAAGELEEEARVLSAAVFGSL